MRPFYKARRPSRPPGRPRAQARPSSWNLSTTIARATAILASSPIAATKPGRGELLFRFSLPLELGPPLNRFAELPAWRRHKLKKLASELVWVQAGGVRRGPPLPGRPMVRAVRFSSKEVDPDSGWQKILVDRLTTGAERSVGIIADDRSSMLEQVIWQERVPNGEGFVYCEIWSGCVLHATENGSQCPHCGEYGWGRMNR